jgi:hypothetical protein
MTKTRIEKPLNPVEQHFIERIRRCKLGLPSSYTEGYEKDLDKLIELGYIKLDRYGRFKTIGSYPDDF